MIAELFLLMLSIPVGVLLTVAPAWAIETWSDADPAAPRRLTEAHPTLPSLADASDHPSASLAVAAERADRYLRVMSAQGAGGELDPMAWLVAGHLRDRFETAVLASIGAVRDWLSARPPHADRRQQRERERIAETLAALIRTLPTFPHDVELGRGCHYQVGELQRIRTQLLSLTTSVDRHRRVAQLPPTSPYR